MTRDLAELVNPAVAAVLDLADDPSAAGRAAGARVAALHAAFAKLARAHGPPPNPADSYLGLAYPVSCLADELLTAHPSLGPAWTEQKLEAEHYGTNDRAWQFWLQAELALERDPGHAEVFLACAGLGFRGEPAGGAAQAERWRHTARAAVLASLRRPPVFAPGDPLAPTAPPLTGALLLRRASLGAALALALAVAIGLSALAPPLAR